MSSLCPASSQDWLVARLSPQEPPHPRWWRRISLSRQLSGPIRWHKQWRVFCLLIFLLSLKVRGHLAASIDPLGLNNMDREQAKKMIIRSVTVEDKVWELIKHSDILTQNLLFASGIFWAGKQSVQCTGIFIRDLFAWTVLLSSTLLYQVLEAL